MESRTNEAAAAVRALVTELVAAVRALVTELVAEGAEHARALRAWMAAVARARSPGVELRRAAVAALGRVLAPDVCAACDGAAAPGEAFCERCAASVVRDGSGERCRGGDGQRPEGSERRPGGSERRPGGSERCPGDDDEAGDGEVLAFAMYGGAIARAMRRFKYGERPDLAGPLGELLRSAARGLAADVVVPVPLHARKLRARGYNQAALLAAAVAREVGAPLAARTLVRVRDTAAQAGLLRAGRLHNVGGAFHVRGGGAVRGRRVVLVDDVCTTGSTLAACRAALLEAGATSVTSIVLARADGTGAAAKSSARMRGGGC